jgi:hypothetical protein
MPKMRTTFWFVGVGIAAIICVAALPLATPSPDLLI